MYDNDKSIIYDVSIVVACYNSDFRKIKATLDSIISQKDLEFEIVIADDGSKENHKDSIKQYFKENSFDRYKIVINPRNLGTVLNCHHGILESQGKFVKAISPGDELCSVNSLKEWIDCLESSNSKWSFCDAVYYCEDDNKRRYLSVDAHPSNIKPYISNNVQGCRWNYVVLGDIALGAAILCERELMLKYLELIKGKVKYAEDNIWRLMMFDGIVPYYYSQAAVLYEYGTGVSTSGSDIWRERLHNDWVATNEIMFDPQRKLDHYQIKMRKSALKNESASRLMKLFISGKLPAKIKRVICPRKTPYKL